MHMHMHIHTHVGAPSEPGRSGGRSWPAEWPRGTVSPPAVGRAAVYACETVVNTNHNRHNSYVVLLFVLL